MCTLKRKDNKDCTPKVEECAGWLYHKEVVHGIGWSPFRCHYCDKPVAQINKIKPHETVCSSSETKQEAQGLYAELFSFVYFKCLSDILLYFYKCSTSMAFT